MSALLDRMAGLKIAVIGDAMLDRTLLGSARRLCPEGPAPVVTAPETRDSPGGAANTALNAAALGARVSLAGFVGDDPAGTRLCGLLDAAGVGTDALLAVKGRGTMTKTRIVADGSLIARLDEGEAAPPGTAARAALAQGVAALLEASDAAIVSDYAYGALGAEVIAEIAGWRARTGRPLVTDARDLCLHRETRPTAVVPNRREAAALLGSAARTEPGPEEILRGRRRLLQDTGAGAVVVTMDRDGALLIRGGHRPEVFPAGCADPVDTCGAGDTFAAGLALALGAGAPVRDGVRFAGRCAAVVVARRGTSVCRAADLRVEAVPPCILGDRDSLVRAVERHRESGRRVVFTNGCFDLLHAGHMAYLDAARRLGDVLIVGVNSDASVRRLKGPERPLNACEDRLRLLSGLACVSHVTSFDEDTPQALIRAIRPDIFVKGGDYARADLPEAALVEELGGEVRIMALEPGYSTSGLVKRIRARQAWIGAAE